MSPYGIILVVTKNYVTFIHFYCVFGVLQHPLAICSGKCKSIIQVSNIPLDKSLLESVKKGFHNENCFYLFFFFNNGRKYYQ